MNKQFNKKLLKDFFWFAFVIASIPYSMFGIHSTYDDEDEDKGENYTNYNINISLNMTVLDPNMARFVSNKT